VRHCASASDLPGMEADFDERELFPRYSHARFLGMIAFDISSIVNNIRPYLGSFRCQTVNPVRSEPLLRRSSHTN
jgi:hypothetical protein